jgi:CBS domain-containing protein
MLGRNHCFQLLLDHWPVLNFLHTAMHSNDTSLRQAVAAVTSLKLSDLQYHNRLRATDDVHRLTDKVHILLSTLVRNGHNAMPLVGVDGSIEGNISLTDMLCIYNVTNKTLDPSVFELTAADFLTRFSYASLSYLNPHFCKPIENFNFINTSNYSSLLIVFDNSTYYVRFSKGRQSAPIVAGQNCTVGDIIDLLWQHKIKRIWIVDDKRRPVSVVSTSDVMNIVHWSCTIADMDLNTRQSHSQATNLCI